MSTLVIIFLSALAIILVLKPFGGRKTKTKKTPLQQNPYHATSVAFDSTACDVIKGLNSRRFLAADAPRIPLPQCRPEDCHCTYVHHEDRRSGVADRRNPRNLQGSGGGWGQRGSQGRRKSDWRPAVMPG